MSRSRVRRAAHSSTHVVRPRVTGVAPSTRNITPTLKRFRLNVASRGFCRRTSTANKQWRMATIQQTMDPGGGPRRAFGRRIPRIAAFSPTAQIPWSGLLQVPGSGNHPANPRRVREISHLPGFVQQTPNPYTMKGFSPQPTRVLVLIAALL
jgi:hypothetical protein